MKREVIDDAFFEGDALLLVEDQRTRLVLSECWSGPVTRPSITVRAVGGGEAVKSLVQSAWAQGRQHVFGLRDVDFGAFRPLAEQPGPVWSTPGHEIENLLLDFDALARLAPGVTADEITARARTRAEALVPWMATCGVLRELRRAHPSFPSHPTVAAVHDRKTALEHLLAPGYVEALRRGVVTPWTDTYLETLLDQRLATYARELASGDWARTFSGKEIFEHLHGGAGIPWRSPRANADDLAMGVAREWRRGSAPAFVQGLREKVVAAVTPRR